MQERNYRVVIASTKGGLQAVAQSYRILENTVKEFSELDMNYDDSTVDLGPNPNLTALESGWIALAYRDR